MFRLGALHRALADSLVADAVITDEASAMEWSGQAPRLVEGRSDNIKVTRPEDLEWLKLRWATGANLSDRVGCIAGKPAPTFDRCPIKQLGQLWEPGLPAMRPVHATSIQCLYSGLSANPTFKNSTNFRTFGDKCRCCGYNAHTAVFGG